MISASKERRRRVVWLSNDLTAAFSHTFGTELKGHMDLKSLHLFGVPGFEQFPLIQYVLFDGGDGVRKHWGTKTSAQ